MHDDREEMIPFPDEPTNRLNQLVALVEKTGEETYTGALRSMSVRMPVGLAAQIEAITQHSSTSRNRILVMLLEVAIDELFHVIGSDDRQEIRAKAGKHLAQMVRENESESGVM